MSKQEGRFEIIEPERTKKLEEEIRITEERLKSAVERRFDEKLNMDSNSNLSRMFSAVAEQIVIVKYSHVKGEKNERV